MMISVIMIYESVISKHEHKRDYETDHEALSETITSAWNPQNPLNPAARLSPAERCGGGGVGGEGDATDPVLYRGWKMLSS